MLQSFESESSTEERYAIDLTGIDILLSSSLWKYADQNAPFIPCQVWRNLAGMADQFCKWATLQSRKLGLSAIDCGILFHPSTFSVDTIIRPRMGRIDLSDDQIECPNGRFTEMGLNRLQSETDLFSVMPSWSSRSRPSFH
jgi:hypothetical protein